MKLVILRHLKQTYKILVDVQQNPTGHSVEFSGCPIDVLQDVLQNTTDDLGQCDSGTTGHGVRANQCEYLADRGDRTALLLAFKVTSTNCTFSQSQSRLCVVQVHSTSSLSIRGATSINNQQPGGAEPWFGCREAKGGKRMSRCSTLDASSKSSSSSQSQILVASEENRIFSLGRRNLTLFLCRQNQQSPLKDGAAAKLMLRWRFVKRPGEQQTLEESLRIEAKRSLHTKYKKLQYLGDRQEVIY